MSPGKAWATGLISLNKREKRLYKSPWKRGTSLPGERRNGFTRRSNKEGELKREALLEREHLNYTRGLRK